ncbi:ribonuclease HI family protein [Candidatus Uhrbacteria bacterium]|nr:ribonuclease HI family protein [Candidatus Uhrbacteria bacterium]
MTHAFTIHSDGGARGNPGHAGIGAVIQDTQTGDRYFVKKYIGCTTNNQAEYRALLAGLEKTLELGAQEVRCYLDSELVVKQLNREYRVKDPDLSKLFIQVWNLSALFKKISFHHVRREQNKAADKLVNEAIDEALNM